LKIHNIKGKPKPSSGVSYLQWGERHNPTIHYKGPRLSEFNHIINKHWNIYEFQVQKYKVKITFR